METATFVRQLYDLYNTHQTDSGWLDKYADLIAPDCEIKDMARDITIAGGEGAKLFLMGWKTAFPDSEVEVVNLFASGDQSVVEFIGRGSHTGHFSAVGLEIAPTGRSHEMHFCHVHRWKDGKVVRITTYYDVLTLLQQLGLTLPA